MNKTKVTLAVDSDVVDGYLRYSASDTASASTARLRRHFITKLAQVLDPLTVSSVQIEDWMKGHEWKPASYNTALACLRHFYRWATRHGLRADDPTRDIRRMIVPRTLARIADDDVVVLAAMKAPVDTRIMIMLGAECGLRRSEIAKVHRSDIRDGWLRVVGKGGHEREVPLSGELLELLNVWPEQGWLFPSRKHPGPIGAETVYRRIRRVSGLNTHSLRHRAGTVVYERTGNNIRLAQEFLGHATPVMTARYVHVTRGDLVRASEAASLEPARARIVGATIPSIDDWRKRRAGTAAQA